MAEIYTKVVGDDGTETFQLVEDLTPIVKETEAYKKVLDESVARRKAIQELKKMLPSDETERPAQEDVKDKTPAPATIDVASLEKEVVQRVLATIKAAQDEVSTKEARLTSLIEAHGLADSDRAFIANAANPEEAAAYLGQRLKVFQKPDSMAAPRTVEEKQSFQEAVQRKMFAK